MDRRLRSEHLSLHHGIAPVREDDSSVYPPMTAQQHIAALVAMGAYVDKALGKHALQDDVMVRVSKDTTVLVLKDEWITPEGA
jgi:hypothetical protein